MTHHGGSVSSYSLSSSPSPSPSPSPAQRDRPASQRDRPAQPLLHESDITPIIDWVRSTCAADISSQVSMTPALRGEHVEGLSTRLWDLRFRGGVWDKQLHRMFGACRVLEEDSLRVVHSFLGGDRFVLWGVADSKAAAHAAVVSDTLATAHAHGIVQAAVRHNLLRKGFSDLGWAGDYINSLFPDPVMSPQPDDPDPGPRTVGRKALFSSPSIFSILKWKTVEQGAEACAKWRDIVSFKFHILRSYARLISRSLQLVVNEVYRHFQTLGMPSMLGVRDMLAALGRTLPVWCTVRPDEADMTDMFGISPRVRLFPP